MSGVTRVFLLVSTMTVDFQIQVLLNCILEDGMMLNLLKAFFQNVTNRLSLALPGCLCDGLINDFAYI
jgi:hypothetical protein